MSDLLIKKGRERKKKRGKKTNKVGKKGNIKRWNGLVGGEENRLIFSAIPIIDPILFVVYLPYT